MREKANLSPEDTIIAPSVLFVQSGLRNRASLTLRANESEGRKHNSFPPTAHPLPPSWIPTIHSTARAHTHSNAISPARSGPHSVPPSPSPLPSPTSPPPSSPSFGPLLKITAPPPPPPNLNGELGIAHRYGLGDSGRSAQIPLSLPMPTHLPLNSHRDWKS